MCVADEAFSIAPSRTWNALPVNRISRLIYAPVSARSSRFMSLDVVRRVRPIWFYAIASQCNDIRTLHTRDEQLNAVITDRGEAVVTFYSHSRFLMSMLMKYTHMDFFGCRLCPLSSIRGWVDLSFRGQIQTQLIQNSQILVENLRFHLPCARAWRALWDSRVGFSLVSKN